MFTTLLTQNCFIGSKEYLSDFLILCLFMHWFSIFRLRIEAIQFNIEIDSKPLPTKFDYRMHYFDLSRISFILNISRSFLFWFIFHFTFNFLCYRFDRLIYYLLMNLYGYTFLISHLQPYLKLIFTFFPFIFLLFTYLLRILFSFFFRIHFIFCFFCRISVVVQTLFFYPSIVPVVRSDAVSEVFVCVCIQ